MSAAIARADTVATLSGEVGHGQGQAILPIHDVNPSFDRSGSGLLGARREGGQGAGVATKDLPGDGAGRAGT